MIYIVEIFHNYLIIRHLKSIFYFENATCKINNIILNTVSIPIKGSTNLIHLLYVTSTKSNVARINPVGVMNEIIPKPKI